MFHREGRTTACTLTTDVDFKASLLLTDGARVYVCGRVVDQSLWALYVSCTCPVRRFAGT